MSDVSAESLTHVEIPEPQPATPPRPAAQPNVGEIERTASVLLGSLLLVSGIKRFSLTGAGLAYVGYRLIKRGATGQCSLYKALHVSTDEPHAGLIGSKTFSHPLHQHIRVEESVVIHKPVADLYKFWRNFENLPRFMDHLESVKVIDDKHSHWVAKAPRGQSVEWDATIVEEEENKKIAWKSAEGARVPNSGQVLFQLNGDNPGTVIKVIISYEPPAGIFGALVAKLFGEEPSQQVHDDLQKFKQIMESGGEAAAVPSENPGSGS